ncbi:unnamed protein product [Darwinula stevensoni]|uniref:Kinesin-like protein n=1 Tax=Darwinula stevensoni TaxID=69355 RepID=A0A7R8X1M6_9CRUS|nr:unnamed protein product [Darwinula stevensoni]CAG0882376.1 unnamed protein product [Darwinula stevensoni]
MRPVRVNQTPSRKRTTPLMKALGASAKVPVSAKKLNYVKVEGAKDPVEVYCRIRPLANENHSSCVVQVDDTTIQLLHPDVHNNKAIQCSFRHIFNENTAQKEVFDRVGLPLVDDLLNGKNGLLFMYGVTGSGKTYTMTGTAEETGVLPRCLDVIFNSIDQRQVPKYTFKPDGSNCFFIQPEDQAQMEAMAEAHPRSSRRKRQGMEDRIPDCSALELQDGSMFAVFVQYVEIYNNIIFDLLDDTPIDPIKKTFQQRHLREDAYRNIFVVGAREMEVKSVAEALDVLEKGQRRRRVAQTSLNAESSRSHSIFTIRVVQIPVSVDIPEDMINSEDLLTISQFSLVDLAGSERHKRTGNRGNLLKEASNINNSLLTLRTCLEVMRENQQMGSSRVIPYRDSKVTHMFKTYFEGGGRVRMLVCISPEAPNYDENIQVLRFAEMTQEIQVVRATEIKVTVQNPAKVPDVEEYQRIEQTMVIPSYDFTKLVHPVELQDDEDEEFYPVLMDDLEMRKKSRQMAIEISRNTYAEVYRQTHAAEQQLLQYYQRIAMLEEVVDARDKEIAKLRDKLYGLEREKAGLQREVSGLSRNVKSKTSELKAKEHALGEKEAELERHRVVAAAKAATEVKKRTVEYEQRIKSAQAQFKRETKNTRAVLNRVRRVLDDSHIPQSVSSESLSSLASDAADSHGSGHVFRAPGVTNGVQGGRAVANMRHRRSLSQGDAQWVSHEPTMPVRQSTVLQPKLKKKKSRTKLNARDLSKSERYLLMHQEQDNNGGIETQFYKGDVLPTCSGGSQVVFQDVEVLRQQSPTGGSAQSHSPRKRSHEEQNRDVEARCSVAVEGHSARTKISRR